MDQQIGFNVKKLRQINHLTLQQLSIKTNLSSAYLSLVERGLTSLTIANLQKICEALNITMSELLSKTENEQNLIREQDRKVMYNDSDSGVIYESMSQGNRSLTAICMTVADDIEHTSSMHVADEIGTIISGSMIMIIDNETEYKLSEGDTLYIPAYTEHRFRKTSKRDCISYWVYNTFNTNLKKLDMPQNKNIII